MSYIKSKNSSHRHTHRGYNADLCAHGGVDDGLGRNVVTGWRPVVPSCARGGCDPACAPGEFAGPLSRLMHRSIEGQTPHKVVDDGIY